MGKPITGIQWWTPSGERVVFDVHSNVERQLSSYKEHLSGPHLSGLSGPQLFDMQV